MKILGYAVLCLSVCLWFTTAAAVSPQGGLAIVPEAVLRKLAKKMVMPKYPDGATKRGVKGRAVAEVNIDKQGNLIDVRVLEAPDQEIEQSVIRAIKQWKFSPATVSEHKLSVNVRGKLTFYFVLEGRRGRVENPRKFQ